MSDADSTAPDEGDTDIDVEELCFSFLKEAPEPGMVPLLTAETTLMQHNDGRESCADFEFDCDLECNDSLQRRTLSFNGASESTGSLLKTSAETRIFLSTSGDSGDGGCSDTEIGLEERSGNSDALSPIGTAEISGAENSSMATISLRSANPHAASTSFGEKEAASRGASPFPVDSLDLEKNEWDPAAGCDQASFVSFATRPQTSTFPQIPFF